MGSAGNQKKLHNLLAEEGVQVIAGKGEFDPTLHEAVSGEASDSVPAGHIIGTLCAPAIPTRARCCVRRWCGWRCKAVLAARLLLALGNAARGDMAVSAPARV